MLYFSISSIILDCSIVQLKLLHEVCSLELNEKIDFLIKASKLGILLDTNIVLALPRLGTPNILGYTLRCYKQLRF